jgi:hypothetical protein
MRGALRVAPHVELADRREDKTIGPAVSAEQ